jgi:hypothetical protein
MKLSLEMIDKWWWNGFQYNMDSNIVLEILWFWNKRSFLGFIWIVIFIIIENNANNFGIICLKFINPKIWLNRVILLIRFTYTHLPTFFKKYHTFLKIHNISKITLDSYYTKFINFNSSYILTFKYFLN